jgi:hypothetical protein
MIIQNPSYCRKPSTKSSGQAGIVENPLTQRLQMPHHASVAAVRWTAIVRRAEVFTSPGSYSPVYHAARKKRATDFGGSFFTNELITKLLTINQVNHYWK